MFTEADEDRKARFVEEVVEDEYELGCVKPEGWGKVGDFMEVELREGVVCLMAVDDEKTSLVFVEEENFDGGNDDGVVLEVDVFDDEALDDSLERYDPGVQP